MSDEFAKTQVPRFLNDAAKIYESRNQIYGDNYAKFGYAAFSLLERIQLNSPDDYNRFGVLTQMLSKISRYAQNFARGGHDDSLDDLAVYSMMLKELDQEIRSRNLPEAQE
jgi:hypothetical protein